MSWKAYQKRIEAIKIETREAGERFEGRRYFDLTEKEREEYLDYILGPERSCTRETFEKMEMLIEGNEKNIICKKKARKTTKKELEKTAADIREFLARSESNE